MIFEARCAGCDRPGPTICNACRMALLEPPPARAPGGVITALPFRGRVRSVMLGFKYRNHRAVGRHLGGLLVNRLVAAGVHDTFDVVTWAPTTNRRRRGRGFDQAEVIARTVARQLGLPARRLLVRTGGGAAQTGRSRAERQHAPVFRARPGLRGGSVLVVDDVVTTGATLRAAAAALSERGASVTCAAIAATPATALADVVRLPTAPPSGSSRSSADRVA